MSLFSFSGVETRRPMYIDCLVNCIILTITNYKQLYKLIMLVFYAIF